MVQSEQDAIAAQNHALLAQMTAIAQTLQRSTVQVRTLGRSHRNRLGSGSGVIWTNDGLIVTNAHVVTGKQAEVELYDGRILTADVTARNVQRDLVALQVQAIDLVALSVADSDRLRVGELVFAVGNPFGFVGALTTGVIHTLGSTNHQPWIQADVQLAPGNSGGPLANAQGQVIGINTMIVNKRGFAVPSNVVQRFLSDRDRPYLGVSLQSVTVQIAKQPSYGFLIDEVESGSPAAACLQPGDVLIGVRGTPFQTAKELFQILEYSNSGDGLPLNLLRSGKQIEVEVVLQGRSSDQAEAA